MGAYFTNTGSGNLLAPLSRHLEYDRVGHRRLSGPHLFERASTAHGPVATSPDRHVLDLQEAELTGGSCLYLQSLPYEVDFRWILGNGSLSALEGPARGPPVRGCLVLVCFVTPGLPKEVPASSSERLWADFGVFRRRRSEETFARGKHGPKFNVLGLAHTSCSGTRRRAH